MRYALQTVFIPHGTKTWAIRQSNHANWCDFEEEQRYEYWLNYISVNKIMIIKNSDPYLIWWNKKSWPDRFWTKVSNQRKMALTGTQLNPWPLMHIGLHCYGWQSTTFQHVTDYIGIFLQYNPCYRRTFICDWKSTVCL